MTPAHRRYIVIETAISVVINVAFSIAFVWLIFGGEAWIRTAALISDAIPQSFMIALMSTVVPTLLTRKRIRTRSVTGGGLGVPRLIRSLPVRALAAAIMAGVLGLALNAFILNGVAPNGMAFSAMLAFKAIYGALLAAVVTPVMLRFALADRVT